MIAFVAQPAPACRSRTLVPFQSSCLVLGRALRRHVLGRMPLRAVSAIPTLQPEARKLGDTRFFRNVCCNGTPWMKRATQAARHSTNPRAGDVSSSSDDHSISQIVLFLSMSIFLLTFRWTIDHPITLLVPFGMAISPGIGPVIRPVFRELGYLLVAAAKWLPTILKPRDTLPSRPRSAMQPTTINDPRQRPRKHDILGDMERSPSGKQRASTQHQGPIGGNVSDRFAMAPQVNTTAAVGSYLDASIAQQGSAVANMGSLQDAVKTPKRDGIHRKSYDEHDLPWDKVPGTEPTPREIHHHYNAGNAMSNYDDWNQRRTHGWDQQRQMEGSQHAAHPQQSLPPYQQHHQPGYMMHDSAAPQHHDSASPQHLHHDPAADQHQHHRPHHHHFHTPLYENVRTVSPHTAGEQTLSHWQASPSATYAPHHGDDTTRTTGPSATAAAQRYEDRTPSLRVSTHVSHASMDWDMRSHPQQVRAHVSHASIDWDMLSHPQQVGAHVSYASMDSDVHLHPQAVKADSWNSGVDWYEGGAREWPAMPAGNSGGSSDYSKRL